MANLTQSSTFKQAAQNISGLQLPVFAAAKIYQGAMVCPRIADGYAVRAGSIGTRCVAGVAQADAAVPTASGDVNVNLKTGVFAVSVSATNPPTITEVGGFVYAEDDQTVSKLNTAGPIAGVLIGFEASTGKALVFITPENDPGDQINQTLKCRAVATSIAAYTGTGTGQLTGSANGAIGAQDGVTLVAGDILLIPAGLSNVTAADAGPYVVTVVGTAGTKYVLTRPWWYKHGGAIQPGLVIQVGNEGTLFASSEWKTCCIGGKVIGTDDPLIYPGRVTQSAVLVAGTKTLANVPIRSATGTGISITRTTANTPSLTVMYHATTVTAGALGTASLVVQAAVAAGTINNADISTLAVTIINW